MTIPDSFRRLLTSTAINLANIVEAAHQEGDAETQQAIRECLITPLMPLIYLLGLVNDDLTGLARPGVVKAHLINLLRDPAVGYLGVIYIDLDRFNQVNERYGHHVGDLLLVQVAERLRNQVRSVIERGDLVARVGGDEFLVILTNPTEESIREIRRRIHDALCTEPFELRGIRYKLGASIGSYHCKLSRHDVAEIGEPEERVLVSLIERAEAAMWMAKRRRRRRRLVSSVVYRWRRAR